MGGRPALGDRRWSHHADHLTDDPRFVDQEWRLVDEHGTEHAHVERGVNRRARTARPPHDQAANPPTDDEVPA